MTDVLSVGGGGGLHGGGVLREKSFPFEFKICDKWVGGQVIGVKEYFEGVDIKKK